MFGNVRWKPIVFGMVALVFAGVLIRFVEPMVIEWRFQDISSVGSVGLDELLVQLESDAIYLLVLVSMGLIQGGVVGLIVGVFAKPYGLTNALTLVVIAAIYKVTFGYVLDDPLLTSDFIVFVAMSLACLAGGYFKGGTQ